MAKGLLNTTSHVVKLVFTGGSVRVDSNKTVTLNAEQQAEADVPGSQVQALIARGTLRYNDQPEQQTKRESKKETRSDGGKTT